MSVECMSRVFKKSNSTGNDRFVLLAIADNAWEDGTNSWPSIALLAWKTGLSERTVQRCLINLEELGELRRDYRTGTSTMYSVLISDKKADRPRPIKDKKAWENETADVVEISKTKGISSTAPKSKALAIDEGTRLPAKQDVVWSATLVACGVNSATLNSQERSKYNAAVKLLKESGATSEEIVIRAENYKIKFPGAALTPMALASHWSALEFVESTVTKQSPENWNAIKEARKQRGA